MEKKPRSQSARASSSKLPAGSPRKALRDIIAENRQKKLEQGDKLLDMADPYEAVNSYRIFQEKKTGLIEVESPLHFCHWDQTYPENPQRVTCAIKRLAIMKIAERCEKVIPEVFPEEIFLRCHNKELYEKLKNISSTPNEDLENESSKFDSVYFAQETFISSKLSAEAAITITLNVAKGLLKNGVALIRPPGHHAMPNEFCGYCYFNNVALAAQAAIDQGYAKRVLIVDYDVHHGQGTQRMFYERNDVLYFSIHRYEHGEFWPNLRESDTDYIGEGEGKGYNVNVPLNATGLGDPEYLAIVLNVLLPIAYEFNPDLILVSAGYDAAVGCPEGEMLVTPHFYGNLMTLLSGLADGKIVVCLEGGYFEESLAEGVLCTVKALLGDICYPIDIPSDNEIDTAVVDVINNLKFFLRDYWECFKSDVIFKYPKGDPLLKSLEIDNEEEHVTTLIYKFVAPKEVLPYETTGFYPVHSKEEFDKFVTIVENLRTDYAHGRECRGIIGYVFDTEYLKHKPTRETGRPAPERPERVLRILQYFDEFRIMRRCQSVAISRFDEEHWIERTHDTTYIKNMITQNQITEKADWFFNRDTASCLLKCVSGILTLAQSIHTGSIKAGVAVIRPPGHHATYNTGSGFCFINNVVIAANYLIDTYQYKRILIVDFDIHHGNGTQNLTYGRSDIMYISVHRFDDGKFFPNDPASNYDYAGEGEGKNYNVNIPFNKNIKSDADYWNVWLKLVLPLAFSYKPEFVIVSAGFDAGCFDPLGKGYKLSPEIFGQFMNTLKPLASGKILVALEGGYQIDTTGLAMTMCVKALLGDPIPVPNLKESIDFDTVQTIQDVLRTQKNKWKMLKVNKRIAGFSCLDEERKLLIKAAEDNDESAFQSIIERCKENPLKCRACANKTKWNSNHFSSVTGVWGSNPGRLGGRQTL